MVDFQALVGDSTDNVPGVPGIGPKTAQELLEKYGTLDAIFEHAGEIKQAKRRQSLVENQSTARLSRELVKLNAAVPCAIPWQLGRVGRLDSQRLATLFRDFGFRSMASKAGALHAAPGLRAGTQSAAAGQDEHRSDAGGPRRACGTSPPPSIDRLRPGNEIQRDAAGQLHGLAALGGNRRLFAGVGAGRRMVHSGPRPRWENRCLDPRETLETLRPVLEDPAIEKFGQNLKYDRIVLRGAGVELAGVTFDTMVASYLLDAGRGTIAWTTSGSGTWDGARRASRT